ncbi:MULTISPECIES: hypothetical protein [Clostridium]|uniref:hypothetical protein n=1 Tax=Clostridium pasteurianum TaxID=1501 RepID=UPI0008248A91|nr:hypothetical protein CUB90_03380 [Clostridium sp. CT7]
MSKKILGVMGGRKNSNSEILLKEALLSCQNQGADVTYYPIECQVCGVGGNLEKTEDGKWKFINEKIEEYRKIQFKSI